MSAEEERELAPVLVSACLLGEECRYDGAHNRDAALARTLTERGERAVPFCPEEHGGLGTPRPPAWIESRDAAAVLGVRVADARARGRLGDGSLGIPESSNSVPDLLDEVRWEVEWMLRMQVAVGEPHAGLAHHKIHEDAWTDLPNDPSVRGAPRYLHRPSTAAGLNLAAVAAQAARVWRKLDPAFYHRCLAAAARAPRPCADGLIALWQREEIT